jgi:AraC-like DNA-binding protein
MNDVSAAVVRAIHAYLRERNIAIRPLLDGLPPSVTDPHTHNEPLEPADITALFLRLSAILPELESGGPSENLLHPDKVFAPSISDKFLERVRSVIEKHMDKEHFRVEILCEEVGLSRAQLHRKLVALTRLSAMELVRHMRLERARDLLEQNAGTVAEIAYSVGFSDPSHFSRCFHRQFGMSPGDVRQRSERASGDLMQQPADATQGTKIATPGLGTIPSRSVR